MICDRKLSLRLYILTMRKAVLSGKGRVVGNVTQRRDDLCSTNTIFVIGIKCRSNTGLTIQTRMDAMLSHSDVHLVPAQVPALVFDL